MSARPENPLVNQQVIDRIAGQVELRPTYLLYMTTGGDRAAVELRPHPHRIDDHRAMPHIVPRRRQLTTHVLRRRHRSDRPRLRFLLA
jgi:hypothetical protein